ncbi:ABZJ_00895 family protein [Terricaulis silvestris]|uniref:Uncharacterized protein n=1 Tax=Terricaulis silvestris TaxID=2686094 RepID=A0A6I6MKH0_9CAUL|nr:ABZJ_00895 family protein [Terricaulis silvestris]QGZ95169.1 hypothetical protein DSM104635_02013 [Terricaulis silvestris]
MSEAAQPTYSVAANLRWFAVVYIVALILLGFIVNLLRTVGVDLPSTGIGIGVFAALVYLAGSRFAARREWTGRDRHNLALGYVAVAITVSCTLMAIVMLLDPATAAMLMGIGDMIGVVLAIAAGVALFYYGMARLMLMMLARRGKQQ